MISISSFVPDTTKHLLTTSSMPMKILFLDQSGKLGGAELSLLDVAFPYAKDCLIGLFEEGSFRALLESNNIPVAVLANQSIRVKKNSHFWQALINTPQLLLLVLKVARLSATFDLIYANTQKALVVGALASLISQRPLVFHLRDILSEAHFSPINRQIAIVLANCCASLVIANSRATQTAFVEAGGDKALTQVVYNGFEPKLYQANETIIHKIRHQLDLSDRFIIGHFSRLSPWKGQQILIDALRHCPENVVALFVGDALFGEDDFVAQLHQQVEQLGLGDRVRFLGFRSDIPSLMAACNLVAHTSISPEPFGRVIVEAMLCETPVVATAAGGVMELIEPNKTGWLVEPGNSLQLADIIQQCESQPDLASAIARQAKVKATQYFQLEHTNQQIAELLSAIVPGKGCSGLTSK
jgi:glycosyltransferase involved in cell wall biosynthesis